MSFSSFFTEKLSVAHQPSTDGSSSNPASRERRGVPYHNNTSTSPHHNYLKNEVRRVIGSLLNLFCAKEQKLCLRGQKGETGSPGIRGPEGKQGNIGQKGDKGRRGQAGKRGPKGEKGDKGQPGRKGPEGQKGMFLSHAATC